MTTDRRAGEPVRDLMADLTDSFAQVRAERTGTMAETTPNYLLNDRGQELVAFVQGMLHEVEGGDDLAERIVLALGAKGWLR